MAELIVGVNSVLEALRGKRKLHKLYLQEGKTGERIDAIAAIAARRGVFVQRVDKKVLDKMNPGNHQGVAAEADDFAYATLQDILAKPVSAEAEPAPFILILDGIEDAGNLGAIIRTAECAGARGIVVPKHSSAEINAAVVRASAGATEHVTIAQETNLVTTLKELKKAGYWVVGADPDAPTYFQTALPLPVALVIGGEHKGLRRLVKENCDLLLKIPMRGQIDSLNASTAAALFMYEIVRQAGLN